MEIEIRDARAPGTREKSKCKSVWSGERKDGEEGEEVEGHGGPTQGLGAPQVRPRLALVWPPCGSPWHMQGTSLPHFMQKNLI